MSIKTISFGSRLFIVLVLLFLVVGALAVSPAQAAGIRYAKPAATGLGNCSSWTDACTLLYALSHASSGDEIWVMAGTYVPTISTIDRSVSFQLVNGVALYGGFAGTETLRTQRDPVANLTILSGDIDHNDSQNPITNLSTVTHNTTNSYTVVKGVTGATLDGFTITGGYGNTNGGGMYNDFSNSPTITNTTFSGNLAANGGGMYNSTGSNPIITNTTFSGNSATNGGGIYNNTFSSSIITNTTFSGNSATNSGGGIYSNFTEDVTITNVTFSGNIDANNGAGIYAYLTSPIIRNSVFWGSTNAPQIFVQYATADIKNSVVKGGFSGGTNIISTDPSLGSLGYHGGFTQTIPLGAGSSAIYATSSDCPNTDQRGKSRYQYLVTCDIGAYEYETHLFPSAGPVAGGTLVSLYSDSLSGATGISFGGVAGTSFTAVNPTKITAFTPSHSAGGVDVNASGSGLATITNGYTYFGLPVISGIVPSQGVFSGGTSVVISGANLFRGTFTFGGILASGCAISGDGATATCISPAHGVGVAPVVVTTPGGTATSPIGYTYYEVPSIYSSTGGPITGSPAVINGTGLTGATSVTIDTTEMISSCTVTNTLITCALPAHAAGSVPVSVTTPWGVANSNFIYYDPPTVTGINPAFGPVPSTDDMEMEGGAEVNITGTNLGGLTSVTFGGALASCFMNDETSLYCESPAHSAGEVAVVVNTLGGTATSHVNYTYYDYPQITSISGSSVTGSTPAVISGLGFTGTTSVTIDGVEKASDCTVTDTRITCPVPSHAAGSVQVIVTNLVSQAYGNLTYYESPTISGLSPVTGQSVGGDTIEITGTHLDGESSVTFGGVTADCIVDYEAQITCESPAHATGVVSVMVTTPGGTATSPTNFTYYSTPIISRIVPNSGTVLGGTPLVIYGSGFTGTTSVTFGGIENISACTVLDTQIACTSPAHSAGAVSVTVTTPTGTGTSAGGFTYNAHGFSLTVGQGPYVYQSSTAAINISSSLQAASTPSGGMMDGAIVIIGSGFHAGDTLSATNSGGVNSSYNSTTGVLTLVGTVDVSVYQAVLTTVTFSTTSTDTTPRTITYSLGAALPYALTGHFFEYVPSGSITWKNARDEAAKRSYNGLTGYLATINDAGENAFATNKLNRADAWIGGSDAAVERTWKWVTGPEAGSTFCISSGEAQCTVQPGWYANWDSSEPNNMGGNEDYLQILSYGTGLWNDLDNTNNRSGYLVEYGGMPGDTATSIQGRVTVNVRTTNTQITPDITWNPASITFGTALGNAQLNATASVPGTFVYTPAAGTILNVGPYTLHVVFTPTDTTTYTNASMDVSINVAPTALAITWSNPAPITYGTALSETQLNATTTVPGTFTYTPASSTVLAAGLQTLHVDFTPTDSVNYNPVSKDVSITINQAAPVITWSAPVPIVYGTALNTTQLNASTGGIAGTYIYSPVSGTVLAVGTHTLHVDFTPADTTNYTSASKDVNINITQATPVITWDNPVDIPYGTALSSTQLNASVGGVAGTFSYLPDAGTVLALGQHTLHAVFTPTDAANYTNASKDVSVTVIQATPIITWGNPGAVSYGTVLSATQLNATASVPGMFIYSPDTGSTLPSGVQTLQVTFTPEDSVNYAGASKTVSIMVNPVAPATVTHPASAITTTTATLNGTVNAFTASTAVTFEYGLTTAYDTTLSATPGTISDLGDTGVSAPISGLTSNTIYHFRVTAVNAAGTTHGSDLTFMTSHTAGIRFVKPVSTGLGNCSTWIDACTLQLALTGAVSGDELWVSHGTYHPGSNRADTFQLKTGEALYGGFAGSETARDQRSPAANVTILSGDIDQNDSQTPVITNITTITGNDFNSYHVVTGADGATLDGFTITAGNANGDNNPDKLGGGLSIISSSPVLANLVIEGNSANSEGGGMYVANGSPQLTAVKFSENLSKSLGGAMMVMNGSPALADVSINDNVASLGGGLSLYLGNLSMTRVTISGNSAGDGGGIYSDNSQPVLTNVTFSGNTASGVGGGWYNNWYGSATLTNVTFNGNSANQGGGLYNSNLSSPVIKNSIFWNNSGGQITNDGSTPVVADSVIQGGYAGGNNIITTDPVLGALGAYGGLTQTIPLLPGSSAIDAGNCAPGSDQRGVSYVGACDIGAYESRGFAFNAPTGSLQSAAINAGFASPLGLTVTANVDGDPVNGGVITFTAPISGASTAPAVFTAIVSDGAVSTPVTANGTAGGPYIVTASAAGTASVDFSLTNLRGNQSALVVAADPSTVVYGTTSSLSTSGGDGAGDVSYSSGASTGCSVLGSTLHVTDASGSCTVTAVKVADSNYKSITSNPVMVILSKADQASLTVSAVPATVVYGSTATLGFSGGDGAGLVTYDKGASTGCSIAGSTLSVTNASGTCAVTATKAADNNYNPVTSSLISITLSKASSNVTTWPTASAITFGQTLASSILSGGSSVPAGTFSFTMPTASPEAGAAPQDVTFTPTDTSNYRASTGTVSVTVNQAAPNVTAWPTASAITYGQTLASSILTGGSSTAAGAFAFTTPSTAPNAGTALQGVTFTPTDTANYTIATGTVSVTVSIADQSSLTAIATPSTVAFGSTSALSTTGGNGIGAVTFSTGSSTGCSVVGSVLSVTDAGGSCIVTATKAADVNYNSATSAGLTVSLTKGSQSSLAVVATPSTVVYGSTSALTTTGGNGGGVVTYSVGSSTGCSVLDSVLSVTDTTGTCAVTATKGTDPNYNPITSAPLAVTLSKVTPILSWSSPAAIVYGTALDATQLNATSGGLAGTFTYSPISSTILNAGIQSLQVDFTPTDTSDYVSTTKTVSITVNQANQTINFTSPAPASAATGGSTYTPTAAGGASGNTVVFTIDASASSVCSISSGDVSFITAGSCVIDANQPGNTNYNAAPQVQQIFAVGKGSQAITFTSPVPDAAVVGGSTYTPTATGGASGNLVVLTIDASASTICAISTGHVSFQSAGACVIDANQAGTINYNAAPQVQQSFAVGKGSQAITFTTTVPASAIVGGASYTPAATGGASGNAVSITIDASASTICSISGGHVSFQAVGTCVVDANQTGSLNYNAAVQVQQSFSVGKGNQIITFTSTSPVGAVVGGSSYSPAATGGLSGNPVAFTIDASSATICSIAGNNVSSLKVGNCVIDANQAGDANYNAASQVQQTFAVGKGAPVIVFGTAPSPAYLGGNFTVSASTNNSDSTALTYSKVSGPCAWVSGATFSSSGPGSCVVRADGIATANFNAASQTQTVIIGKANQPTLTVLATPLTVSYGSTSALTTSGGSGTGAVTYSAGVSNGCSILGSTLSIIDASGTCSVTATKAGDTNYNSITSAPVTVTLTKANSSVTVWPTASAIMFGQTLANSVLIGGTSAPLGTFAFTSPTDVPATGMSQQGVTFTPIDPVNYNTVTGTVSVTVNKGNSIVTTWPTAGSIAYGQTLASSILTGGASIPAGSFAFTTPGLVPNAGTASQSVTFSPTDSTNYHPTSGTVSVTVNKANQAVFTVVSTPSTVVYGSTSVLSTTGGSGIGLVSYSSGASTGCSVTGSTLTVTKASGSCNLTATKAADSNYNSAISAVVPVTLSRAAPVITWSTPAAIVYGTSLSATQLNATATVPGTFSYSPAAGTTLNSGSQSLRVDFIPDDSNNYASAFKIVSITVSHASQSITYNSSVPASAVIGGSVYTPTATGGASGNAVVFTIDLTAAPICSISGGNVSFQSAGLCIIDANQAGNSNFTAATQVQQSFAVGKIDQSISFTSTAPASAVIGGVSYPPAAIGGASGNSVVFTIDPSAVSVCSITGGDVSYLTPGICVIDANQAGNASYKAAPQVQQSFTVGKGSQVISFISTAPVSAVASGTSYTPSASGGSSGSPVAFTIDISAASVCSITAGKVTYHAVGSCVIDANQAGNTNYNPAPQVQQSFAVGKGSQNIFFSSIVPVNAVTGGAVYTPTATGGPSGNVVIFTVNVSATSVCTIVNGHVAYIAAGTCVIDADQPGNVNYFAAPQVQQSFVVGKGSQSINFTSIVPVNAIIAGSSYTPAAIGGGSSNPVIFTIDAVAASVCSLSGADVWFLASGLCVINANQAGDTSYNAAPPAQQSFSVSKIAPIITFDQAPSPTFLGSNFTVNATTTNTDSDALSYSKVEGSCAFLGGSTFSSTGAGTCIVRADSMATTIFKAAAQTQHITIGRANPNLVVANTPAAYTGSPQAAVVSAGAVPGSFTNILYNGSATVPTTVGSYAVTGDFIPVDTADYNSLAGVSAGNFEITKATPVLTLTNSPVLLNGAPQAAVITAGSVAGAVSNVQYDGSPDEPVDVGTYTVTADFTPVDTINYNSLVGVSVGSFVINYNPETPVITWDNPVDIVYGTALSGDQLDATVNGIPGVFEYNPGPGTVLPAGVNTLHVTFTPTDLNNFNPASKNVNINVIQAVTTTSIGSSANPLPFGQTVTFTTIVASGAGTPVGSVTFMDGTTILGTSPLSDGSAIFTTNALETGMRTITAEFSAAGNYAGSVSDPVNQTVNPVDAVVMLVTTSQQTPQGQTWTFVVSISLIPSPDMPSRANALTDAAPAGTVTLKDGSAVLGTSTLSPDGTATFVITNLPSGTHHITAEYSEGGGEVNKVSDPVVVKSKQFSVMLPFIKK